MPVATETTIVGVFPDRRSAESAITALRQEGFTDAQIGVLDRHDPSLHTRGAASEVDGQTEAAEGSATGAAVGAGIGVLWAIGIAAQAFPPLGIVIGGPLVALLASAGTGATIGAVTGALIGAGIPEDDAHFYTDEVKGGRTLVTVHTEDRAEAATAILGRFGGTRRTVGTAATPY